MSGVIHVEKLQPCLLDRLTDHQRNETRENRLAQAINHAQLRASVIRDLEFLLNTTQHWSHGELNTFPWIEGTTLNYGIADFVGIGVANIDRLSLQNSIRTSILYFEPRVDPTSVHVKAFVDSNRMDACTLSFAIEVKIWAHPFPILLDVRTDMDFETGYCMVSESLR